MAMLFRPLLLILRCSPPALVRVLSDVLIQHNVAVVQITALSVIMICSSCGKAFSCLFSLLHCHAAEQELADHARQVRSNISAHPALTPLAARGFA